MAGELRRCFGSRRGTWFYHAGDGYQYHLNRNDLTVSYMKCIYYERGCRGRAVYTPQSGLVESRTHNHGPDFHYPAVMQLRHRILQRCRNPQFRSYVDIVREEQRNFVIEVRARVTANSLRSAMRRARMEEYPPVPFTLAGLYDLLRSPQYYSFASTLDGEDNLLCGGVAAADGSFNVIFVSNRMLHFLSDVSYYFIDGTFKSRPCAPENCQVLTVVTVWRHHVLPIAWVLMERKTEEAYVAVLGYLRDRMVHCRAQVVVTDFETGLQNAVLRVLNIDPQGCLFHAVNAMLQMTKELGLDYWIRHVERVKTIVRLCCALPLLPLEFIWEGLFIIGREAMSYGPLVYFLVRPFLAYVQGCWVDDLVRRSRMSVSGSEHRTNNASESANKSLHAEVGTRRPSVYNFISGIVRLEDVANTDLITLRMGWNPSRRRRVSAVTNDQRIQALTHDLYRPIGTRADAISDFLHAASHTVEGLFEDILDLNVD